MPGKANKTIKQEKKVTHTYAKPTWCPGCTNFAIMHALKQAMNDLIMQGYQKRNFVIVAGIGCHGKIADYLDVNSVIALHGRSIPLATGIKLSNNKLNVICHVGDGDTYDEGISHFIHAAKRNADITVVVHNNKVFALTKGQPTATSWFNQAMPGIKSNELPLNPIALALISNATFVARAYARKLEHLTFILKQAIMHRGFSFVDVLQPCLVFANPSSNYDAAVYDLQQHNHNTSSLAEALAKAYEAELTNWTRIPIGIFYKVHRPVFSG